MFKNIIDEMTGYFNICEEKLRGGERSFSDTAFALEDGGILCLPRPDGDERYPYGEDGFNFWAYTSGYMHANDGLFSVLLRADSGADPKVAFFVSMGKDKPISLLSVPELDGDDVFRFTVFSKKKVMYFAKYKDLRSRVTVTVAPDKSVGFAVDLLNAGSEKMELKLSSYMDPYLRNSISPSSEDKWFRTGRVVQAAQDGLSSFVFTVNEDISRTESVTNIGVINRALKLSEGAELIRSSETVSDSAYKGGARGSLHNVGRVFRDGLEGPKVCAFTENAIAGDLIELVLPEKTPARYEGRLMFVTAAADDSPVKELLEMGTEMRQDTDAKSSRDPEYDLNAGFDEGGIINAFLSSLSTQVEFCSLIKGYVQLSPNSLIGIRDVFQALEGYICLNPEKAADKMLEALDYVTVSGRCPRQYSLPSSKSAMPKLDLREFIDQGCWVIDCIVSYLKLTGDMGFLDRVCGYIEIVDEAARDVKPSGSGTVLDHMIRITDYLLANQDEETGCIRILYGDWNDAIDGLGVSPDKDKKFGSGVSVMASLQVYRNLTDMIELLQKVGGESEIICRYENHRKSLEKGLMDYAIVTSEDGEKRIVHGWGDKRSYFVGSFCDCDNESRYGLSSYAFWALSGMNEVCDMKPEILKAYNALDSKYGYRTFTPAFGRDVKGVGRIYKLPPGTAENGASYIHATTFAIMSLFMTGEGEKAWEQIMKIVPFTHEHVSCSPFVMPNSYGYNPELNIDGESMQDWQTGSSNVLFKAIVRYVLGFVPGYDELTICPAAYYPYGGFSYSARYKGKTVKVRYSKSGNNERKFTLNGVEMAGTFDRSLKTYKLQIEDKRLIEDNIIEITDNEF